MASNIWKYLIPSTSSGFNQGLGMAERQKQYDEQMAREQAQQAGETERKTLEIAEKQRETQVKASEKQKATESFQKYLMGGQNVNTLKPNLGSADDILNPDANITVSQTSGFSPYSQEEKNKLLSESGLTANEQLNYLDKQKKEEGEKNKFTELDTKSDPHAIWGTNYKGERVKVKEFKDGEINPEYKPERIKQRIGGLNYEAKFNKFREDIGDFDPKTGEYITDKEGKPIVVESKYIEKAKPSKSENVGSIYAPKLSKELNTAYNLIQNDVASFNATPGNEDIAGNAGVPRNSKGEPYYVKDPDSGKQRPLTKKELKSKIYHESEGHANLIKQSASPEFNEWLNGIYQATNGQTPDQENFIKSAVKNHQEGNLSAMDYQDALKYSMFVHLQDPKYKVMEILGK